MHLYAIRHGQSFVNLPDWKGEVDAGLTPLGQKQAEALAAWLPKYVPHVDAIYCSTMLRPRETVVPLAAVYKMPVTFDDRLREIGEMQSNYEVYPPDKAPTVHDWIYAWPTIECGPFEPVARTPMSETPMHMRARVASVLEELIKRHLDQHVILVAHGGIMTAIFDYCFGVGPWKRCEVSTYNTGVTHFQYVTQYNQRPDLNFWTLRSHNLLEHLRGVDEWARF
ncbi:MAG: histidine phosphatase family protein [Aggregatilineales bacterium]